MGASNNYHHVSLTCHNILNIKIVFLSSSGY